MSATLPTPTLPGAGLLLADKIRDRHAVVYVRQSTVRQVQQHQESARLQYALADRARQLGWHPAQVVAIDDDMGRSAASTLDRPGFQRLVAEVGLGHVGLVLGIEVSRLARSCRDWHQLLEMCALFDTLMADADGLYDPGTYNDRLLLGLKGTMSEAELHILKARIPGRGGAGQRGGGAWGGGARRAVLCSVPRARWRLIRTSRSVRRSGWCSTCSSAAGRSGAC